MMSRYVAFLRGINVGGNRKISMIDQRTWFESMGFSSVGVVLQTGNVIFESDRLSISELTQLIESRFYDQFQYPATVMVVEMTVLRQLVAEYPFQRGQDQVNDYVVFLSKVLEWPSGCFDNVGEEKIRLASMAVYWQVPRGMTLTSSFSKLLTKATYRSFHTIRNLNTLDKIIKK
ncbi:DUF1697 domain-containing protein [bacterium]|nr:DUF1697 domain-containing protein [bacterium]